jgi:hypothetical protein
VSPRLPCKGALKPLFHKPLPQIFYPPPVHPYPTGDQYTFIGEQQGLRPFTFLSAVFPFVDNLMERVLFLFRERYFVFFLRHRSPPLWFLYRQL